MITIELLVSLETAGSRQSAALDMSIFLGGPKQVGKTLIDSFSGFSAPSVVDHSLLYASLCTGISIIISAAYASLLAKGLNISVVQFETLASISKETPSLFFEWSTPWIKKKSFLKNLYDSEK